MEGGAAGGGEQDAGVPSMGAARGCHHVSTASPSPLATGPPQGPPATSCGVRDRGDRGVAGPQPCQEPQGTWEGISPFPPLLRPWVKK